MKKIIVLVLVLTLVFAMSATAFAATPKLNIPSIPNISNIKITVSPTVIQPVSFWDQWLADHPFDIRWNWK